MSRLIAARILMALAMIPFLPAAHAGDAVELRPDLTPGATVYVEFTWDNDDTETGSDYPPEGQRTRSRITYGFWHRVESVDASGAARIRLTIDRAALNLRGGDTELHFDTDAPDEAVNIMAYGKKLQTLCGQSFGITVNPDGRVTDLDGLDEILRAAFPDNEDPQADEVLRMASILSLPAQTNVWRQYYGCFAFGSVETGATWTRRVSNEVPLDVQYTLDRVEGNLDGERVVVIYTAQLDQPTDWRDRGNMLIQSGPYRDTGRSVIDRAGGRLISSVGTVYQEVRGKKLGENGKRTWWLTAKSSATHTVSVTDVASRKAARRDGLSRAGA